MTLAIDSEHLPTLATNCVILGHAQKADVIWTRDEFLTICAHMLNGNAPTDFLLVYRDKDQRPRFAKSKKAIASRRATWSWDTITGAAKSKVGIGFYPTNKHGKTRWGAMDFDAHHDGEAARARAYALAAFDLLHRNPQFFVVLGTSGSEGWHLFVFTSEFHPIAEWTKMLKGIAGMIAAPVEKGICEVFPNEAKAGMRPSAIRAPGTWNPKTDAFGSIVGRSNPAILLLNNEEKEVYPFLYHASSSVEGAVLHDREQKRIFRGRDDEWAKQFAITKPASRREQLKALVIHGLRQAGRGMVLANARLQFAEKTITTNATADEHGNEAAEFWDWAHASWLAELSERERAKFELLNSDNQRDVFRIVRNFARHAESEASEDFPFPVEEVGNRIGKSFQTVGNIRARFISLHIIHPTAPCVPNVRAARFKWIAEQAIEQPF